MVNGNTIAALDKHWEEVMTLAKRYGFIIGAYGGTATLATHEKQLRIFGTEDYVQQQKVVNGINVEVQNE